MEKRKLVSDACYPATSCLDLDRLRRGLPPLDEEPVSTIEDEPKDAITFAVFVPAAAAEPIIEPEPELVSVASLAASLPDPARPFWWFSSTPLPDLRISAGCPIRCDAHTRLPREADYWCYEGDESWQKVDRDVIGPKPVVKKKAKTKRRVKKWVSP